MTSVLLTGGTGKTGRALAGLLRDRGEPVRIASRTPSPGDVSFNWHDPAGFPAALAGVDRVFLVPEPLSVDPLRQIGPFLDEAERAGVRRVVLLGSALEIPGNPPELADRVRTHPGWVVLRASGFMQNFLPPHPLGERIREHGEIRTSAPTGQLGWIDTRDIAAAAAAALTIPHPARDYLFTGPKAVSYQEVAEIITAETGRPVRVSRISAESVEQDYRAAGVPPASAAALAAVEGGIEAGKESQVSTAVLDLTGHSPRTFAEFVRGWSR